MYICGLYLYDYAMDWECNYVIVVVLFRLIGISTDDREGE